LGAASFIAAAKGEPKGIAGAAGMSAGVEALSGDLGVNRLEMDACGNGDASGLEAAVEKGDGFAAGAGERGDVSGGDADEGGL
jgi:hypothetical protein